MRGVRKEAVKLREVPDHSQGKRRTERGVPSRALKKRGERIEIPDVAFEDSETGPGGVVTDKKLIRWFYQTYKNIDAEPITTDQFIERSKAEYNHHWLARELVQNFVDHNPHFPGTLDGVDILTQELKGGAYRFTIKGQWPFRDTTGVTSPHSEKPSDRSPAGGNGIGLKQVALRLLRDFDTTRFDIIGEEWTAAYRLARAEDVNHEMEEILAAQNLSPSHSLQHDWLLADLHKTENSGSNSYIIETTNAELIETLKRLEELGVSRKNKHLQNPDYQNEHGSITWLGPEKEFDRRNGRLFINGQVMHFKEKGHGDDYWKGPEFATVRLDNVKYRMSIDRPPVTSTELRGYVDDLVSSMDRKDFIDQLKRSEAIWSTQAGGSYFEQSGAFVILQKIVQKLHYSGGLSKEEYSAIFGDKSYLANDGVQASQAKELRQKGFILCDGFFGEIGMPYASSKLGTLEKASNEKPKSVSYELEKLAKEFGIPVAFDQCEGVTDSAGLFTYLRSHIEDALLEWKEDGDKAGRFRLTLNAKWSKALLSHEVSRPKDIDQKLLHLVRGFIKYGLEKSIFAEGRAVTSQGDYVTTFKTEYDSVESANRLIARNVESKQGGGVFVEFDLTDKEAELFRKAMKGAEPVKKPAVRAKQAEKPKTEPRSDTGEGQGNTILRLLGVAIEKPKETSPVSGVGDTLRRIFGIPVKQPDARQSPRSPKVIERVESHAKGGRLEKIAKRIPEIKATVDKLEGLVPDRDSQEDKRQKESDPVEKYLRWRGSGDFYGEAGKDSGYITGRSVLDIMNDFNQADIPVLFTKKKEDSTEKETQEELGRLNNTLKEIINRTAEKEDQVDEFEIVLEPSAETLAKIGLLRSFVHLATGAAIPNDLFVYRGTGSKGVNIAQKAIGIHEALLEVDFYEAFRTMVHEVAHNGSMKHDNLFRHISESLSTEAVKTQSGMTRKLDEGEKLSESERALIDIEKQWKLGLS